MDRLQVILGTRNSLPHGESNDSIEAIYQTNYRPALRCFFRFPDIKFTLFYSGLLLEWMETHRSEFPSALKEMSDQRKLELLLGGFADPAMPIIPRPDRLAHFEASSTLIRKIFGKRLRGAAMGLDTWDQDIVSSLHAAGLDYVFLDDWHFDRAGLIAPSLHRPVMTDDQGKAVLVFPTSNRISRACWNRDPAEVVSEIARLAENSAGEILTILFPGEVPRNYDWTAEDCETWLSTFLEGISRLQADGVIATAHPGRLVRKLGSRGHVFFPPTHHAELLAWNGDPETRKSFMSGRASIQRGAGAQGHFHALDIRQQTARYVESHLLRCKMLAVHTMVSQIRGDRYRKEAAREELLRAQGHEVYWHGEHGGIYRPELRRAAWSALLKAERHAREKGIFTASMSVADLDMDGSEEILYQGLEINGYVHRRGGALFELDYLQAPVNYLDTMARYPEHYHDQDRRNEGYDLLPRWAFLDCFVHHSRFTSPGANPREAFQCLGDQIYAIEEIRKDSRTVRFVLETELRQGAHSWQVRINKTLTFNKSTVFVEYQILNKGTTTLDFHFCPEISLNLGVPGLEPVRMFRREGKTEEPWDLEAMEIPESQEIYFEDPQNRSVIHCQLSESAPWWNFPVWGHFRDRGIAVRRLECNTFQPRWYLGLEPGFSRDLSISLSVVRMRGASLIS